jgi:hypothetical protein
MKQKKDAVKQEELPGQCHYCGEEVRHGMKYCDITCKHLHQQYKTEKWRQTTRRKAAEGNIPNWWL